MWKLIFIRFYTFISNLLKQILFPIDIKTEELPKTKLYKKNNIYYILNYRDNNIRYMIHRIKFSKDKKIFKYLGYELSKYIPSNKEIYLLPVPQTKSRLQERGYDVTNTLVKEIQKHIEIKNGYGILRNIRKDVQSQIKDRDKRIKSVKNTIRILGDVKGRKYIILDDVFTTGSTIREVEKNIIDNGGKVLFSICIAH